MLSRDMDSNAEVEIYLSSQSFKDKIGSVPHPNKSGWKIEQYKQEWLTLKGKFLDKTYFELTLTELSKTIRGKKRTSSGKIKQKSKTKIQGLNIKLRLTYPQGRYGAVKVLKNDVNDAVKIPYFCQLKLLKITDKNLYFVVKILPDFAERKEEIYQTIAMMFLSLYQILNLAKMLSR